MRSILVDLLTKTIGNLLLFLNPNKVRELTNKGISLTLDLTPTERLMRRAIINKMQREGDFESLAQLHKSYWSNKGDNFVKHTETNLENTHLPNYKYVFDLLEEQIKKSSGKFSKLIEIGTGNGSVLDFLSSKFNSIEKLIGIDLSENQIKSNNKKYKGNKRLTFIADDAIDWFNKQPKEDLIILTFRGVLEYFTEKQLNSFLKKLNDLGNVIFLAIEPIGENHNYDNNPNSKVYGVEGSFSHNYQKLFNDAGFYIWYYENKAESGRQNFMSITGAQNFESA
ncbi:MAG: class I SAM-dependent methyltransferase [bacterium]